MSSVKKIAIVGAGVIGATTAFRLQEQFGRSVSINIFSDEFSPNTTSDVSAGLWGPFLLTDTPPEQIVQWSKDSHDFFHKLWLSGDAAEAGVCLVPVTRVIADPQGHEVPWKHVVFGYTELDQKIVKQLSDQLNRSFTSGSHFTTFTCEPSILLPYLYKRIENAGGQFERKRIESFDELSAFDIVINCTGLGAKVFDRNDVDLQPVRGQVMRIKAPWINGVFLDDSDGGNYIIPNMHTVVLGGTFQVNDYNTNVDANDRKSIYDGCMKLNPAIKGADIVLERVGLRPARNKVRLERDIFNTKNGKKLHVVHNYGHGGSGVTLSYGCAIEAVDIVKGIIKSDHKLSIKIWSFWI